MKINDLPVVSSVHAEVAAINGQYLRRRVQFAHHHNFCVGEIHPTVPRDQGSHPRPVALEFKGQPYHAALNHLKQWVAYESGETGNPEIHVRPYPGPGKRVTISSGGGHVPLWSRDGRELYYRKENEIWAAPITIRGDITAGPPKRLFRGDFLGRQPWESSLDVSADGRFLFVSTPPEVQPERRLAYIPNWTRELKQIGSRR
jgi:hypothetical protein